MQEIKPKFSLKDQLFNKEKVEYLSGLIKKVNPDFLNENFEKEILDKFPKLELKQRISHISDMIKKYLLDKTNFEKSINILIKSLPKFEENWNLDNNFWDFIFAPYSDFIAKNWCNKKDLELSFNSLEFFTSYFSSEFAIRKFFNEFEWETYDWILKLSKSKNYHHRRLASEWSRQKLPWAEKINLDYKKTIKILDNLYFDKSRYVTRSVANHLNDISKIDWDLVINILKKWKKSPHPNPLPRGEGIDLDYIISHWTRTLVKLGDKNALEFLGYSNNPKIEIKNFVLKSDKIKIWENLDFNFDISWEKSDNLIIDYKIHFLLKNWKYSEKVFKIKKIKNFVWKEKISKKHPLKLMTTRNLNIWKHYLEIQINGKQFEKKECELI
jgi:3-methyladenine DNA glycosylase AlkC